MSMAASPDAPAEEWVHAAHLPMHESGCHCDLATRTKINVPTGAATKRVTRAQANQQLTEVRTVPRRNSAHGYRSVLF